MSFRFALLVAALGVAASTQVTEMRFRETSSIEAIAPALFTSTVT